MIQLKYVDRINLIFFIVQGKQSRLGEHRRRIESFWQGKLLFNQIKTSFLFFRELLQLMAVERGLLLQGEGFLVPFAGESDQKRLSLNENI